MNPNQTNLPTIPFSIDIKVSPEQSAILGMALFLALLFALLIFGFLFKS